MDAVKIPLLKTKASDIPKVNPFPIIRRKIHVKKRSQLVCNICRDTIAMAGPEEGNELKLSGENCLVTLKCNHHYHYECIYQWYMIPTKIKNSYTRQNVRKCPYCRKDGGFLPMNDTYTPVKEVHYLEPPAHMDIGHGFHNKCQAVIASKKSLKYGQKCHIYSGNKLYCHRHKKFLKPY